MSLEISLASFVFHVSVYDKDLDPMITLKKRFKTPVRKIFPRFIVCRRLRTQGRCLPSPCTAFSQSLSVNSFQWRIRDERAGNTHFRMDHVTWNALAARKNEA